MMVRDAGADELLVKPVSPKSLYEHISRTVLRDDKARQCVAFVQNQRRLAERKRTGSLTFL